MEITDIQAIDWNLLRQKVRRQTDMKEKKEEDWDKRADSFAKRTASSIYIDNFLTLLSPSPEWSVLDVGSGPGTLAIPLASKVKTVTCIDFSEQMLNIAQKRADQCGLKNITTCKASWEDDWHNTGLEPHDVAVASRSLAVDDLKSALERLTAFAQKKVVITDKVGPGPFDPQAFKLLNRPLNTGPDYIYTVNLLYQMGYHATVDFIRIDEVLKYESVEDAQLSYNWMFPNLTEVEKITLKKYIQSITSLSRKGKVILRRQHIPTWAFISWKPEQKKE